MLSLFRLALDKIMLENPHTNLVKTGSKILNAELISVQDFFRYDKCHWKNDKRHIEKNGRISYNLIRFYFPGKEVWI